MGGQHTGPFPPRKTPVPLVHPPSSRLIHLAPHPYPSFYVPDSKINARWLDAPRQPKLRETHLNFPNNHLQYAITW